MMKEVRIMQATSRITADGPYLHVLLPDVLPPDWEALRRDLEPEIEEGARHVTFVLGRRAGVEPSDLNLIDLVASLRSSGLDTLVLH
jgi:hypothetical protein